MVVVLVMIIALGVGLTAVSGQLNLSSVRHEEHQAYYTALSSTETVAAWITENTVPDDRTITAQVKEASVIEQLLQSITDAGEPGITIDEAGIPPEAGTCTVNLRWLDGWSAGAGQNHTQLKITSVATFAGVTETVSLTLDRAASNVRTFDGELEASNFSTDDYDDRADWLNNRYTSEGVVALYESSASNYNIYFNGPNTGTDNLVTRSNKAVLASLIDENSTLEARWTNLNLTSTLGGSNNPYILGTERLPKSPDAATNYTTDWRRFMVPENGRITIDPLEHDGSTTDTKTGDRNTRIVGLAIHDTNGKNVLFRLASTNAARGTADNVFVSTTSSTYGTTISNTTKSGIFAERSDSRYASLITLDFTDNAKTEDDARTENASYTIGDRPMTPYIWHPNKWNSMDLFVQSGGEVDTNLILGPFAHKHDQRFDYKGEGSFRDSYNGQADGTKDGTKDAINFGTEWPYATGHGNAGLPFFSVDFGKKAGFWILDGGGSAGDKYFRIMQGVNILGGADSQGPNPEEKSIIYSTRKTIIGGALIRGKKTSTTDTTKYFTTDSVNCDRDGFAVQDVSKYANYVEATTRFSQLIYNTDIILMAPSSGKTAASEIRRPQTWRDRRNMPADTASLTDAYTIDTRYEPTMTIAGGTIYVGERQSLTIQGTVEGKESGTVSAIVPLDNMWISPDKIVVAEGGKLTIESSKTTNVITDIYVEGEGSTLIINAGAKIKGNIYAYNGGTVDVRGGFELKATSSTEYAPQAGGVFIYGDDAVKAAQAAGGALAKITGIGHIVVNGSFPSITDGNDALTGQVYLVGGEWGDLGSGATLTLTAPGSTLFFSDNYNKETGRSEDFGGGSVGVNAGWIAGPYDSS
jgi:hypothetical protein